MMRAMSRWRKCHLKYVEIAYVWLRAPPGPALGELTHSTRSPSRNWGLYTCKGTEGREGSDGGLCIRGLREGNGAYF